ncbi:Beta-mannosidase-like Protein [Tribolium castaneum]|uniref:beta-mannosidase n=1 Tax=Tribolium castaneum TaxID=7070 RepID=D6WQ73_TRICA|nr:PREDICTED: beta-mannosidase [Tribolium castaneum]EFA06933.2 Beta-mannosidase-like Protein [Tribolium castaneum]|eukprot:XP_008196042.1 PREDICTED: beta-mannosidase [Tribolium castaneum]
MVLIWTKFSVLILAGLANGVIRQGLNGQWKVTGGPNKTLTIDAYVPGGIFSALMESGTIGDIFYGTGDSNYSWVGLTNWTYSTTFTVSEELLNSRVVLVVFEGLDTFATVSVNGHEVGTSENMFVRYNFNIRDQLQVGANEISVQFASAVATAEALAKDPSNEYVIPPECPVPEYKGICYVNRIRKQQASFAWDWGPAFASVGIWGLTEIIGFDDAFIEYLVATPLKNPDDDFWTVPLSVYLNAGEIAAISGTIDVSLETEKGVRTSSFKFNETVDEFEVKVTTTLLVPSSEVSTWWPNGYGTQSTYKLLVTFVSEHERDQSTVHIGFRTVELVQEKLGTGQGLSFYYKVNQVPIFAKGANAIPINILPERSQSLNLAPLFETMKSAHMNMLRVWGGGVYNVDYFYSLADDAGIMIWQDFMFACALYPTDDAYLKNVVKEVKHQVRRLASHPSVVIWAGNNENEAVLAQDWYDTMDNFTIYKNDYVKLYVDVIRPEVLKIVPNATYLTSSPTNGLESDQEGYVAQNPGDSLYGDVHFYDYTSDSWAPETFPIPRFASEYGYQSMPSIESWLTATASLDDLRPDSAFMDYRQHHPGGNDQNVDLIELQMQLPDPESENYVKAFIYFSQILQAQAMKIQTEHYRSFKGRVNEKGEGNTMGALYWQLNDVWVAPTWSGIDFTGRWKMLQYFAKDFFNPMIITGRLTDDNLEVYAICDGLELPNVTVKGLVQVYKWESLEPLIAVESPISLDLYKSVPVTTIHAPTALQTAGCGSDYAEAKKKCFFHLRLLDQGNNILAPFNYIFPEKLKNCALAKPAVKIESVEIVDLYKKIFSVTVSTDAVALFVWLDTHEVKGVFSENGFLQVLPSKTVNFTADSRVTLEELQAAVTVTHLSDPAYL